MPNNPTNHSMKSTPMDDFDRLAAAARSERPPLIRADVAAIRRRLHSSSQQHASMNDRQSMPATLMIFSSAFTGLAACAVVAVMLQITHEVSLSTQAGTTQTPAAQVGLTMPINQTGTPANPSAVSQSNTLERHNSSSTLATIDPVADLFEPLQLDLP